jgi:hypothetical protein
VQPDYKVSFVAAGEKKSGPRRKVVRKSLLANARDWILKVDYHHREAPFPAEICVTNQRPDMFIVSRSSKTAILIELTCPAEENILDAQLRMRIRYDGLKHQIKAAGWTGVLKTIEVGTRGCVAATVPRLLAALGITGGKIRSITKALSACCATCSFEIYKARRVPTWNYNPPVTVMSSERGDSEVEV